MFDFFIFLCVAAVWGIGIWIVASIWANFKRGTVNVISEAIDKSNKSFRK